jgi:hypothetical protein
MRPLAGLGFIDELTGRVGKRLKGRAGEKKLPSLNPMTLTAERFRVAARPVVPGAVVGRDLPRPLPFALDDEWTDPDEEFDHHECESGRDCQREADWPAGARIQGKRQGTDEPGKDEERSRRNCHELTWSKWRSE